MKKTFLPILLYPFLLILIATLFVALSFRPTLFHLNSSLQNSQNLKPKIWVNDVFDEELQKKISSGYVNFENVEICLEKQANWESGSQTFTIFELAETIVSASQAIAKNKDVIISVSSAELCEKNCVLYLKIQFYVDLSLYCENKEINVKVQPIPITLDGEFILKEGVVLRKSTPIVKILEIEASDKILAKALGYLFKEKTSGEVVDKYICGLLNNLGKISPIISKDGVIQEIKFENF